MSKSKFAKVLLNNNRVYSIHKINYETNQITLKESEKIFLTVFLKDVEFLEDENNLKDKHKVKKI